jgi:hypothetical protein
LTALPVEFNAFDYRPMARLAAEFIACHVALILLQPELDKVSAQRRAKE